MPKINTFIDRGYSSENSSNNSVVGSRLGLSNYRTKQTKTNNLSLILWQVEKFRIIMLTQSLFLKKSFEQEKKFFHFGCYERAKNLNDDNAKEIS